MSIVVLALLAPASAGVCADALYAQIPRAETFGDADVVTGNTTWQGTALAGGRVSMRSAWPLEAWEKVLRQPELQQDWLPDQFGVTRTARLDPLHMFEQMELSFLLGAIKARRQMVIEFEWRRVGAAFDNCWALQDPAPFSTQIAAWVTEDPWQRVGLGGWRVVPAPGGGSNVSYELWTGADVLPAIQAWAVTRTLPDLIRAFEVRVGATAK